MSPTPWSRNTLCPVSVSPPPPPGQDRGHPPGLAEATSSDIIVRLFPFWRGLGRTRSMRGDAPPPLPPSRQTRRPTSRPTSRRRVLPDVEGGVTLVEVGTNQGPGRGVGCAGIMPFCIKPILRGSPCSYHSILHGTPQISAAPTILFFFWQLRQISPTRWAPRRLGGGGAGWHGVRRSRGRAPGGACRLGFWTFKWMRGKHPQSPEKKTKAFARRHVG